MSELVYKYYQYTSIIEADCRCYGSVLRLPVFQSINNFPNCVLTKIN